MSLLARLAAALVLAVVASACSATTPVSKGPAPGLPVPARHVLPNGVRVIVQEHRTSDVVALQLWVRAGARDEAPSELGLAHYLEHMLFKGTTTRPPGFVERDVEGVGGRINAGTTHDYTYYHSVLPAARTLAGIEILADISQNASLDESLLQHEKQVVLEEMRLSEDTPRRHLFRLLYGIVFDGHPYGRPVIGTPELIRGLTREALVAFYRRTYVPEAFTLVAVGPVSASEVRAVAERTFGRFPRTGERPLPAPAPPAPRLQKVEVERPGGHAYLGMAWLAPRVDHADVPALALAVWILGQSRSSRLVQSLRERQGLVSTIGSGYSPMQAAGVVTVTAQLPPTNLPRAEDAILREIARVREEGVSEAERRRAVTAAEARHAFATETAEGRAYVLGRAETVWRLEDELAYLDRLRGVTLEQVRAAARRYLDPARYGRLALVPASR